MEKQARRIIEMQEIADAHEMCREKGWRIAEAHLLRRLDTLFYQYWFHYRERDPEGISRYMEILGLTPGFELDMEEREIDTEKAYTPTIALRAGGSIGD